MYPAKVWVGTGTEMWLQQGGRDTVRSGDSRFRNENKIHAEPR